MFMGQETPLPGWRDGDGNAAYLDKTLRFRNIETELNEGVSGKFILFLLLRAMVASFLVAVATFVFGLLLLVVSMDVFLFWMFIAGLASPLAFWGVLLFSREPEPIAEWRVLLAEREGRRDQAYLGIRKVIMARRFPVRIEEKDGRLVLTDRSYVAYISVFPYGSSLYLGWMMWRSRVGYQLIWQFLSDIWANIKGRNQIEHQILRSERARAIREAVHLASREGLMVALDDAQQEQLPRQGISGQIPAQPPYPTPPADPTTATGHMPPPMPTMPPPMPFQDDSDGRGPKH